MKSEGFGILCFLFIVIGFGIIGVSEDYSRNAMLKTKREQQKQKQINRNKRAAAQFAAKQSIYALGCVTLDCAIEKSIRKENYKR